jgi:hypothetical protein
VLEDIETQTHADISAGTPFFKEFRNETQCTKTKLSQAGGGR